MKKDLKRVRARNLLLLLFYYCTEGLPQAIFLKRNLNKNTGLLQQYFTIKYTGFIFSEILPAQVSLAQDFTTVFNSVPLSISKKGKLLKNCLIAGNKSGWLSFIVGGSSENGCFPAKIDSEKFVCNECFLIVWWIFSEIDAFFHKRLLFSENIAGFG